jgi:RNA recognition motif-containing protein
MTKEDILKSYNEKNKAFLSAQDKLKKALSEYEDELSQISFGGLLWEALENDEVDKNIVSLMAKREAMWQNATSKINALKNLVG